jgi:hypothetical protein
LSYIVDVTDEQLERLFPTETSSISSALSPARKTERAFSLLKANMIKALEGQLESAIYVMSADCGTGKSAAVQAVIRQWVDRGFTNGSGILVCLSTKAEIDAYIRRCALDEEHYAVVTSDCDYSRFGLGKSRANDAPVLFTTHQQVERRLNSVTAFKEADSFHYKGKRRSLCVWDEALMPAPYTSFELCDLQALPSALRHLPAIDRVRFAALLPDKAEQEPGCFITVSEEVGELATALAFDLDKKLPERIRKTLEGLGKLGGGKAFLRGSDGDFAYIGAGKSLPRDIGPLFVLDASARLTNRYADWSAHGLKVVNLEPAAVSYRNLRVCWWDKGAGKAVLATAPGRAMIFEAMAELINGKPAERWLVVLSKSLVTTNEGGGIVLPTELTRRLKEPQLVSVLTWGRHLATNDHAEIENVIVVGGYSYTDPAYEAMHLAVSGGQKSLVTKAQQSAMRDGEFSHNLYQAVCRTKVRRQVDGVCDSATAYLIMSHSDRQDGLVRAAFPDCSIEQWVPVPRGKESKTRKIIRVVTDLLSGSREAVSKEEVISACGSNDPTYLDKVLKSAKFKAFSDANGIYVKRGVLYRAEPLAKAA